jgi:membrane protein implicated in regulation of membrane protease activity
MLSRSRAIRSAATAERRRRGGAEPGYHSARLLAIYIGALLFGGVLIAASALGLGDHSVDGFSADAADPHAEGSGHGSLIALFGVRFWSFATTFFGITGLLLHVAGVPGGPVIAAVVGVGAGLTASVFFRKMTRDVVGRVGDASALVGRIGKLLLPVARAQQGKVRLAHPGGGSTDLVATSDESDALAAGAEVIVVEVRGNVAVVARAPASIVGRS